MSANVRPSYWVVVALFLMTAAHASSLYDDKTYRALATDHRAYRVGDTLTVLIYETAEATNSASTRADRKSSLDLSASDIDDAVGAKYKSDNQFSGGGIEQRSGKVLARVSVSVAEVLENGELQVEGEQIISLNQESQRIHLSGRVRPEDITAENTVLSPRLADAKIDFKGKGMLSSREKPGILIRFFQWLF